MTKAKYQVWRAKDLRYSCVTTTRNTEDMINVLSYRFLQLSIPFKIIKIQDGKSKVVYDNFKKKCFKSLLEELYA